jgi:cell division protease FtsH
VQEKAFSDATANRLDGAVREMVDGALERAVNLNLERRDRLDALVAALLEHETLDAKEVTAILGPSSREDYEAGVVPQQPATIEATILDHGKVQGEASRDGSAGEPVTSPADPAPAAAIREG